MTSSSIDRIYIKLLNNNDPQNHPSILTPPIYCKLKRYRRDDSTANQEMESRDFDLVANAYGLEYGVLLLLSQLTQLLSRYRLVIKIKDALGFKFVSNRPIMLTQRGQVNTSLLPHENTFFMILDYNTPTPMDEFQNNSLYQFPNVGAD